MANQNTSLPKEKLDPIVKSLFLEGKTDVDIVKYIAATQNFTMSTKTIQRSRTRQQLRNAWNVKLGPTDIAAPFAALRQIFPLIGAKRMKSYLWERYEIPVSREVICQYMKDTEPEATAARKARRIQRRQQFSAGVNVTWTMDQHDKWRVYGLLLHIWWNNRNPNLICKYYVDAVESTGGIPLLTQSDGGSENYNIAKAQTVMRQTLDPTLAESIQHSWMGEHPA